MPNEIRNLPAPIPVENCANCKAPVNAACDCEGCKHLYVKPPVYCHVCRALFQVAAQHPYPNRKKLPPGSLLGL